MTPPATPTASITSATTTITLGQSVTINATFSVAPNDVLTAANIDMPLGTGLAASTAPGPKSYVFTPSAAGTYTFYARAQTQYYSTWTTYATRVITVVQSAPTCTLTAEPASVTQGQTATVQWACANASTCTGTNFSTGNATSSSVSVTVNSTTEYKVGCTGVGGGTYNDLASDTVAVTCAPLYSCSGSNVTYTNASCVTSTVESCSAPGYCVAGQSACQFAGIEFVPSGGFTGHLQAQPGIVRSGDRTRLYWHLTGAVSCSVTGGGQTWTGLSSSASGVETNPITQLTRYTLNCDAYDGHADVTESINVLLVPVFDET